MATPALMKTTEGLVDLLNPLTSEERQRVVQAAFALLGEVPPILKGATLDDAVHEENNDAAVSAKARMWMKQNEITAQALEQVFHLADGAADFIAGELPGKNDKEKTLNAYIIAGLTSFLLTGDSKFTDQDARKMCADAGCYNLKHHGEYIKAKGNNFTGTKEKGWALTSPGLKTAAQLVQGFAKALE
jgi:hypothetical protein